VNGTRRTVTFEVRRSRSQRGRWLLFVHLDARDLLLAYVDDRISAVQLIGWAASLGIPESTCAEGRALLEADRASTEVSLSFQSFRGNA
jgi:hypothetical protein